MITYSKRIVFLNASKDVGDFFKTLHGNTIYGSLIGMYCGVHSYVQGEVGGKSGAGR